MNQQLTKAEQIKPLLLASQRQITSLLKDEVKAKKFMAASLVVASDPSLRNCSADSIVQALIGVAMADLNIDKNIGHCYFVPYKDSVQLQIGYKGFIQLLYRAGWMVKAVPVYQCDQFHMEFDGWDNKIEFIPGIDIREEGDKDWVYQNLRGVYVVARHVDTKDEYSTFVNKTVIEKLRLNSPNQRIGNFTKPEDKKRLEKGLPIGIWADWYVEMSQAKAIKKLAKILPIGDNRAATAIATDDKSEMGKQVDYRSTAESGVVIEMNASDVTVTSSMASLETILNNIDECESKEQLDALLPDIDKLNQTDKKAARSAWVKQIDALKKQVKPDNQQTEETDWERQIKECGDSDTLTALLNEMPEAIKSEHDELINLQYDSFR